MKLKLFFNDGTDSLMYGDYSGEDINNIEEQMKRPQNKRLYVYGIEFKEVIKVEVLNS